MTGTEQPTFVDFFISPTLTVKEALLVFEKAKTESLPIVANGSLMGYLNKRILQKTNAKSLLDTLDWLPASFFIKQTDHVLFWASVFKNGNTDCLALLDSAAQYIGTVTKTAYSQFILDSLPLANIRAVVELEMASNDYSFSKIAAITESEKAKILFSQMHYQVIDDLPSIRLVLGLDTVQIRPVLATLARLGYTTQASYVVQANEDSQQQHLGHLFKFLEV
jgi:CBS domain-containing protein